jgi:hypothetical protein
MDGETVMHATEARFVHTFYRAVSTIVCLENLGVGEMKILKFIRKKYHAIWTGFMNFRTRCFVGLSLKRYEFLRMINCRVCLDSFSDCRDFRLMSAIDLAVIVFSATQLVLV